MKVNFRINEGGIEKIIEKEYGSGTLAYDAALDLQKYFDHDIILARRGTRLLELRKKLHDGDEISFITTGDSTGAKVYERGMILLVLKAFYSCFAGRIDSIKVRYKLGDSLYCDISGIKVTKDVIDTVLERMHKLVDKDLVIDKKSVDTVKARQIFSSHKMYDKERLFEYRRVSKVNIYNLDGFEDYFYGYMPYNTGVLKYFSLTPYAEGFLINIPDHHHPEEIEEFRPRVKLFNTLEESKKWSAMLGVNTVGGLNDVISSGKTQEMILVSEALQEKKIAEIAQEIADKKPKIVLIAGPSSSGKTSFSYRLSIQLRAAGLTPHPIGVDNYFQDRSHTPRDENGNYDFECLEAIDAETFNKDMNDLLDGRTVSLPTFDFVEGKRLYHGNYLKLGEDDILVIEGIHCLNEKLTYSLPKNKKFKIYISALTQLNVDEHNRIPTTDGRLIRRIVRDARTRGISAAETIKMWYSVRRGEDRYIFPFQEDADVMFNSALLYELSALKPFAEADLFGISKDAPEYVEAKRLLKFLDYFIAINTEDIPHNSLLREFVGGSIFNV